MSRKAVKLVLFIFGAAVTVFWSVLFFMNMSVWVFDTPSFWELSMFTMTAIIIIGLVPMSIAMLMHAYDIKHKKKGFAVFLTILSIFWLAGSALNVTIMVVLSLIFGWHIFM